MASSQKTVIHFSGSCRWREGAINLPGWRGGSNASELNQTVFRYLPYKAVLEAPAWRENYLQAPGTTLKLSIEVLRRNFVPRQNQYWYTDGACYAGLPRLFFRNGIDKSYCFHNRLLCLRMICCPLPPQMILSRQIQPLRFYPGIRQFVPEFDSLCP